MLKPYLDPSAPDTFKNPMDTLTDHRGRQFAVATALAALLFSGTTSPDAPANPPANSGSTEVFVTVEPAPLYVPVNGDVSQIELDNPLSQSYIVDVTESDGVRTVSVA